LGQALEALDRVAQLVEAVVEGPVLAAVHRLLADEAGDLALQLGIGDLVAEVAYRPHEEVLAVGEHGRQAGGHVAQDEVAVVGVVLGQVLEGLLEGDAAGRHLAFGVARLAHSPILDELSDSLNPSILLPWSLMTKGEQTRQAILEAAIARFGRD